MNPTKNTLYSALIVLSITGMILAGSVGLRYSYSPTSAIESGIGVIVLFFTAGTLWFHRNRPSRYMNSADRTKVIFFGIGLGLLWVIEISINNFIAPPLPARDIVDNIFWAIIGVSILGFSTIQSYRKDSLVHGIEAGVWNGSVSGLLACCMALIVIVFGMRFILQDPLNVAEWAGRGISGATPSMAAYFAFETFAGAFGHLIILGAVMGCLAGVIGGSVGKGIKFITRWKRKS